MKPIRNASSRDLTIDGTGQFCPSGDVVEVDDDLAESLLDQPDVWRPADAHVCTVCGFEAASAGGLTNHLKSHDEEADR